MRERDLQLEQGKLKIALYIEKCLQYLERCYNGRKTRSRI